MKIAIEGCCHGELEKIYETIEYIMNTENIVIDLLICCGDFQCPRNVQDMESMSIPSRYLNIGSFYKYYTGEKVATLPTIFVHGNHEAVSYLKEMYFGGWVAPNIYYMGYSGVINFGGLRIAGISGIFKEHDYYLGHYEMPPYTGKAQKSSYHTRQFEIYKIMNVNEDVDIMISHDWPLGIYHYGNAEELIKKKKNFSNEIHQNELGSWPLKDVLFKTKPLFWFSAHLHVKFAALVLHSNKKQTKFLALDKCLPSRDFLQIVDIVPKNPIPKNFYYDVEWLAILHASHRYYNMQRKNTTVPQSMSIEESMAKIKRILNENGNFGIEELIVPRNFAVTVPAFDPSKPMKDQKRLKKMPGPFENPQTIEFAQTFSIDLTHCCASFKTRATKSIQNSEQINIDDNIFFST